jgi:cobalt/nickel transport system permease protein
MHIPDGYLSPGTCAALFAGALPFWRVALRRVKSSLHTRLVPLISLFSAFCFVIMMFNLPLPGGTTGHAIGTGLAAVVLGPWAAMLSVSVALAIQALFFGDGGITAFGANCFNMAIAGSLVTYFCYRLMAGRSPIDSMRRVIAAGLGAYIGINIAALLAAVEFGIQPLLFRDTLGTPLYCPYPLSVSIPAMMIGHLTVAGMAELILSAGSVALLQRSNPSLLKGAAGLGVSSSERGLCRAGDRPRTLWAALCMLLILTPLGILAVGTAWGEWVASDFSNPAIRQQIAGASRQQTPPARAPEGLEQISRIWTAPFSHYAPPYIRNAAFGYFLSAMFGAGLVMAASSLMGRFMRGMPFRAREAAVE